MPRRNKDANMHGHQAGAGMQPGAGVVVRVNTVNGKRAKAKAMRLPVARGESRSSRGGGGRFAHGCIQKRPGLEQKSQTD